MAYVGLWERWEDTQLILEIRKNREKITMDVIVIYQADQEIAALDLKKFNRIL